MRYLFVFALGVFLSVLLSCTTGKKAMQQKSDEFAVIAYYLGDPESISQYPIEKLTHIIFSFCHLRGNRLAVDNANDSLTIRRLVSLKSRNPKLKVLLSLGGWGGCKTCSEVFNTASGRSEFCRSVRDLTDTYQTDGLDLDWEYPAIAGFPGHQYMPEDKPNFTALVRELRQALGPDKVLSFAAGGFTRYLSESIEWDQVMPHLDYVNVMSYDYVSGGEVTGHNTLLYSTPAQPESTDRAVSFLDSVGVPARKIIIGAAFYARLWELKDSTGQGLNQPGTFKAGLSYHSFKDRLSEEQGFVYYWDSVAQAPYRFNAAEKLFATFDDRQSVRLKTRYAINKGLGGIMFWQLGDDEFEGGLLNAIFDAKQAGMEE